MKKFNKKMTMDDIIWLIYPDMSLESSWKFNITTYDTNPNTKIVVQIKNEEKRIVFVLR